MSRTSCGNLMNDERAANALPAYVRDGVLDAGAHTELLMSKAEVAADPNDPVCPAQADVPVENSPGPVTSTCRSRATTLPASEWSPLRSCERSSLSTTLGNRPLAHCRQFVSRIAIGQPESLRTQSSRRITWDAWPMPARLPPPAPFDVNLPAILVVGVHDKPISRSTRQA